MSQRHQATDKEIDFVLDGIRSALMNQLKNKGRGIFISAHETLGVVTEEYHEYVETVRGGKALLQHNELEDLAVAAIFGMVSINSGKMDW